MSATICELFAGGGGVGIGAKAAGIQSVGAVEYDADIASVYARNVGDHVHVCPVQEMDYELLPPHLIGQASPPCPNFSAAKAGAQETQDDINMAEGVCRYLRICRPAAFVLENVPAYRKSCSFARIVETLDRLEYRVEWSLLNSANFGVPQTRVRLILRAVLGGPVPLLQPAVQPWVGWYAAIEDLIPTLPESQFAKWQLDRLPDALNRVLIDGRNARTTTGAPATIVEVDEPCFTVTASDGDGRHLAYIPDMDPSQLSFLFGQGTRSKPIPPEAPAGAVTGNSNQTGVRAFLMDSQNSRPGRVSNAERTLGIRDASEPSITVTAGCATKGMPRAFLISDQSGHAGEGLQLRGVEEPVTTIRGGNGSVGGMRAFLVGGSNTSDLQSAPGVGVSLDDEPTRCVTGSSRKWRAWLEQGRVVSMTTRALARFQSFPDWYILPERNGLAARVIGNACPPLMMQRIFESLLRGLS